MSLEKRFVKKILSKNKKKSLKNVFLNINLTFFIQNIAISFDRKDIH